jgi:hypothetical protein
VTDDDRNRLELCPSCQAKLRAMLGDDTTNRTVILTVTEPEPEAEADDQDE